MGDLNRPKLRVRLDWHEMFEAAVSSTFVVLVITLLSRALFLSPNTHALVTAKDLGLLLLNFAVAFLTALFVQVAIRTVYVLMGGKPERIRLKQPPGSRLLRIADFFVSPKTFEEVLEPAILDMRHEYFEALVDKRPWKARWVLARGYSSFLNAAGLMSLVKLGKSIVKVWKLIP